MAVYTYQAFEEQATDALRLAVLRQHISEVRALTTPNVGADGKSRDVSHLVSYLAQLNDRRRELEQATGTGGRAPCTARADFRTRGGD